MNLPSWRLHALKGDMLGHWSVKVNGNWRLTFRFEGENVILVNYQDFVKRELKELSFSITKLATHIGVSRVALSRVLNGHASITPLMSLKFSEAFGQGSSDIWFRMQNEYDFWLASRTRRKKVRPLKVTVEEIAA